MTEELTKKKSDMIDQIDYKNLGFLKKLNEYLKKTLYSSSMRIVNKK